MKTLLLKYHAYIVSVCIVVVVVVVFRFRESELKQQLHQERMAFKKKLIKEREAAAAQAQDLERQALKTITIYRDRNQQRKQNLHDKPIKVVVPVRMDSVLAVLNGANRKL